MKKHFLKVAQNKIYWTIFLLVLFQIGLSVTIPGAQRLQASTAVNETFYLSANFSWFMLGISAYMVSSLAISILSSGVSSIFTKWKKGNEVQKKRLQSITMIIALGFSYVLALFYIKKAIDESMFIFVYAPEVIAALLSLGTFLTIKIGKSISEKGVFSGMSVLVLYNIIRVFVINIMVSTNSLSDTKMLYFDSTFLTVSINLAIIVCLIVIMFCFTRKKILIPVFDEKIGTNSKDSSISISYNSAGFSPLFVTSVILGIINPYLASIGVLKTAFDVHIMFYLVLVPLYMFCSYKAVSPKKKASFMRINGLLIPGVTPGADTERYLRKKSIIISLIAVSIIIALDLLILGISQFEPIRLLKLDTTSILLCAILLSSIILRIRLLFINTKEIETLF